MSSGPQESGVYVVLGATGGIGSSVVRRLAESGHRMVLAARRSEPLVALAEEASAESMVLDATDFAAIEECFQLAVNKYGRVDGAVNCVGSLLLKPAHLTTPEEWHATLALNLGSAFAVVRSGAKAMIRSGGSIVLISSAAAALGLSNHEAIAAAKAGIAGLTRSAAATYASRNIRVNAVAPGLVETPMTQRITANASSRQASLSLHPLGRLGQPQDVAEAIVFLLGCSSAWITGQVIGVDGGLSTVRSRAS